jgi:hypothetical protein
MRPAIIAIAVNIFPRSVIMLKYLLHIVKPIKKINCIISVNRVINHKNCLESLQKTCPKCSLYFECLESIDCWCFHLERYCQVDRSIKDCICDNCLLTRDDLSTSLQQAHKQVNTER